MRRLFSGFAAEKGQSVSIAFSIKIFFLWKNSIKHNNFNIRNQRRFVG